LPLSVSAYLVCTPRVLQVLLRPSLMLTTSIPPLKRTAPSGDSLCIPPPPQGGFPLSLPLLYYCPVHTSSLVSPRFTRHTECIVEPPMERSWFFHPVDFALPSLFFHRLKVSGPSSLCHLQSIRCSHTLFGVRIGQVSPLDGFHRYCPRWIDIDPVVTAFENTCRLPPPVFHFNRNTHSVTATMIPIGSSHLYCLKDVQTYFRPFSPFSPVFLFDPAAIGTDNFFRPDEAETRRAHAPLQAISRFSVIIHVPRREKSSAALLCRPVHFPKSGTRLVPHGARLPPALDRLSRVFLDGFSFSRLNTRSIDPMYGTILRTFILRSPALPVTKVWVPRQRITPRRNTLSPYISLLIRSERTISSF